MIAIKDFEMPKDCDSCPFCSLYLDYEDDCRITGDGLSHVKIGERHKKCPLVVLEQDLEYRKEWLTRVRDEIEELAKFHSINVPMAYGDGEETVDKMVSLEELGRIFSEIEDAIGKRL